MGFLEEVRTSPMTATNDFNAWGRRTFYKSYASGGLASYAFTPRARGIGSARVGSREYLKRLEGIRSEAQASGMGLAKIDKAIGAARNMKGPPGVLKRNLTGMGGFISVGFVGHALLTAEGGVREKTKAAAGGLASGIGFDIGSSLGGRAGMYLGASLGAAAGSVVPIVGTAIGAVVGGGLGWLAGTIGGGFVGSSALQAMSDLGFDTIQSRVDKSRQARTFGWRGDTAAFNTQSAYTMRSASLQMMNKGMLSARSGLGHEGVVMHR